MDKYQNGDDWKKLCKFGIDTKQRLPGGYTMERTLFDCGEYSWDGNFNIVTLPENMSIYHGGGSAANNLAFIPLGRHFLGNLAQKGPANAISDAVPVIERKEAIYPVLSQYGGPNPAWFSNPYTAYVYAKRNDDRIISENCSKEFYIGEFAIHVRDCILAFKLMRDMKLIRIDDPYNIMVIHHLFAGMSPQEIQDIQPMLEAATKPGAMEIRGPGDLVTALSLYCFGSVSDKTGDQGDRFKPIIDLNKVELKQDEDHAVEHCNRYYLAYPEEQQHGGVVWLRISHFMRKSSYDWDLVIGTALCFLLRTRIPEARYDGYGAPYVRSDWHTSWRSHGRNYFSLEMTICNAADILTRDYDNPIDWQSPHAPDTVPCPAEAREYIDFLGKHVVTNYKEYAGNMYENMVWTMLVTEHMLTTTSDDRFKDWRGFITQYGNLNAAAYIASILAFFCNFRETVACLTRFDDSTCEVSYYSCNMDDARLTYMRILASRSLVNALNIMGGGTSPADTNQVYLLVNAFLDAQPHIFRFLNQTDDNVALDTADKVLSMIIKNSYQFGTETKPELIDLMLVLGLTVIFASILIRGSPVGIIPILTEPIPGQSRCNLRSGRFPWIENRSRPYPGTIHSKDDINEIIRNITYRFILLARTIKERQDQVPAITQRIADQVQGNLVFPSAIQQEVQVMYNTLFPGRQGQMNAALVVLGQLYANLREHEAQYEEYVRLQWEQGHNERPAIDIMRELDINIQERLSSVIDLPVTTREELKKANDSYYAMWVGYLGIAYIPAMERCNSRLTLQFNQVPLQDAWIPAGIGMRKFERVWHILKILKPILGAIIETYSMTQYPALKTYPARYNHNSLNHLRSVWYTAVFLANSGFTNHLNNMDIFLLLLGSVFKSIGRTDESNAGPSARDYNMRDVLRPFQEHGNLPNQRWPALPPKCGYDFSTWTMPGTVVISMTIAYQVLCSISHQFPLQQSKYSETIVFTSGIIANDEMLARYDTCQEMKDVVDSVSIMCMGHYLDHCRPTTRFSQLDTITNPVVRNNPFQGDTVGITDFNKPLGQPWLKFLLERYDFQNDGWHSFKQFWFDKQIDVLTRTGFQRIIDGPFLQANGRDHASIGAAPSIEVDWGQRCGTLFDPTPTDLIVTLANSFDRAWDAIFIPQSLLS